MLVKCISFIITVFGTKRYKPLLFACAALLISLTGISAVAAFGTHAASPIASTASANDQHGETIDALAAQTPHKQAPRDEYSPQASQSVTTPETTTPKTSSTPATPQHNHAQSNLAEITLSASTITIAKNSVSEPVKASMTGSNSTVWSVAPSDAIPSSLQAIFETQDGASTNLTVKVGSAPAGNYSLVIEAKDNTRGVTRTKTLTVIVTE